LLRFREGRETPPPRPRPDRNIVEEDPAHETRPVRIAAEERSGRPARSRGRTPRTDRLRKTRSLEVVTMIVSVAGDKMAHPRLNSANDNHLGAVVCESRADARQVNTTIPVKYTWRRPK